MSVRICRQGKKAWQRELTGDLRRGVHPGAWSSRHCVDFISRETFSQHGDARSPFLAVRELRVQWQACVYTENSISL